MIFFCDYAISVSMKRIAPLFAAALLLGSCAGQIRGSLDTGGSGAFMVSAALQPGISALIRSLAALGGQTEPNSPIIDGAAAAASISAAPGITSVSLRNTSPAAVEGPVTVGNISDFLAIGGEKGFIRFEPQQPSGGRCVINISLDSGPQILSLLSPSVGDYLAALMAPLATGEALSVSEYLTLVTAVYGKGIAGEIQTSFIRTAIDFPGPVLSAKGGSFNGRRAEFAIPLLDLLVLETPLIYEVEWR
jgi:hypothetical protein